MGIIIECRDLPKEYGGKIIFRNLSIKISSGDALAVIGPSGSGKTILLRIIGLISKPSSGRLIIMGIDTSRLDTNGLNELRQRYLGYSFQEPLFINSLNVLDNVILPLAPFTNKSDLGRVRYSAMELLRQLGLRELFSYHPYKLSTGERKRVDLARALIKNPSILIVDEPTANLDEESADIIHGILRGMIAEGKIVIYAFHRDDNLMRMASKKLYITR